MKDAGKTKEELIYELVELRQRNAELEASGAKLRETEEALNERTHALVERVKELGCLYGISRLLEEQGNSLEGIIQGTVDLIPPSWQYPEVTCARIVLDGQEFRTQNFRETHWKQDRDIVGHGEWMGIVEVCYVEERPSEDEGPFLKEERYLLNAIAERLGRIIERKRTEEEHLKLSRAVEQSPSTIVITDTDGNIEYVNPRFTQITGYSLAEVNGENSRILKSGEMTSQEYKQLWNTITNGGEWRGEFHNRKANGEFYWEAASISPIKNREGNITHFVKVAEDITALKRSEEELREQRDRLAELVEERTAELRAINEQLLISENSLAEAQRIAHFGNWDWDIVKNELRWSDEIYRIFGLTPQEFGATYEAFLNSVHPDDREFVDDSVNNALYKNEPYSIDHHIILPGGSERVVHEQAEIFLDDTGQAIRMVGTVQDITERRRAEEELEAQRLLSMRSDRLRSLGEMAAGIAHELNQPLVGVRGLSEHLLLSIDRGWELTNEKIRDRARLIIEQADRMVHIIEHIRIFARDAGKPELRPVHINNVVKSSTDMLGTQFRSRGIELVCELADDLPVVSANPFSLEEVVINLLINARDAMEQQVKIHPGSTPPRIVLRTLLNQVDSEECVRIEVIDSGGGIPEHIIDKVFDPFFTTKGPDGGTGLGLSISRSIVEDFGGKIQIQSTTDSGTTVIISLPVGDPRSQEEQ